LIILRRTGGECEIIKIIKNIIPPPNPSLIISAMRLQGH